MLKRMYAHNSIKVSVIVLLVMILSGLAAASGQVEAAPIPKHPPSKFAGINPSKCSGIELHLTGKDQYTVSCTPKDPQSTLSPDSYTYRDFCNTGDIALHYNYNYDDTQSNGDIAFPLCISGTGSINDFWS